MFIYLFQQRRHRKWSLSPRAFPMARELTNPAHPRQTGDTRRDSRAKRALWFPGCYRSPAWPLASAFPGQGQEATSLLVRLADRCPIFVAAWKVSGWGAPPRDGLGRSGGRRGGQPSSHGRASSAAGAAHWVPTRAPHAETHLWAAGFFAFFAIRTDCHHCVAPSPLHQPAAGAGGCSGERHDSGAV